MAGHGLAGPGNNTQGLNTSGKLSKKVNMNEEKVNGSEATQVEAGEWPLWRVAARKMRLQPDFGYGASWSTEWFEHELGVSRDTNSFAFQMLELRQDIESKEGYYLRCQTTHEEGNGNQVEQWIIPSAVEHEDVARGFEGKMRRYADRSVSIRVKTLGNDKAKLDDSDRAKMDSKLRIAATRIVLLRREKSIYKFLESHEPKLLK